MSGPIDDDPLMDALGDLLRRTDPVPEAVTLAARSALAWRRMDAELAELLHDSTTQTESLAGVRSMAAGWRMLTFETTDGISIDIEVAEQRSRRTIVGQINPPCPAAILVRLPGSTRSADADERGRFEAGELPSGPVSLRIELPGGTAIETGWVTI